MTSNGSDHPTSEDVTIDILSRLSVKSLMRFRCVCRHWSTLIRNSRFISKHIHHKNHCVHLLVQRYCYANQKYALAAVPYEMLAAKPFVYHDHNLDMPINPSAAGPFHGMFCFWDRSHIAMWNPALKELRPLSVPKADLPWHFNAWCHHFGFGMSLVTNDYKVIWLRYYWDEKHDNPYQPIVVSVYTMGTDSWRVFEVDLSQNGFIYDSLCNTYMDGAYYWLTVEDDNRYKMLLFDMDKEVFREIDAPPNIAKSQLGLLSMCDDSIALFFYDPSEAEKCFDIWVMKKEGNWTRLFTTSHLSDINGPLGLSQAEEIFLEASLSQLALYNPGTREIKHYGPSGKDYSLKVFIYKESLVSVERENECWDEDNSVWLEFRNSLHSILQL